MAHTSLARRVDILEHKVEILKDLPARMTAVEAQIVQLRSEMHGGFSALSYAINAMHADVVTRFEAQDKRFDALDGRFDGQDRKLGDLRGDMHVLHEDVLERIARLGGR